MNVPVTDDNLDELVATGYWCNDEGFMSAWKVKTGNKRGIYMKR